MKITVELFGRAATQGGERQVVLEVPEGATCREVAQALVRRLPALDWVLAVARPARNLEYVDWSTSVAEGDEVSFIPPVSGGAAREGP
jgi:MoaE-MoaD fusion protein